MRSFLRVWEELELNDIKKHLLIIGELSCECFCCHAIGIEVGAKNCPNCGTVFKYIGFRRKIDSGYIKKLKQEDSEKIFIDFDDFKKAISKQEAKKFLDIQP
ncbi:MAG: hypothetical protein NC918_08745 [Candidatus Omnitrophica bacterium]|nr:hypothetical protein [Candidatus Omnitrophota bacterium]